MTKPVHQTYGQHQEYRNGSEEKKTIKQEVGLGDCGGFEISLQLQPAQSCIHELDVCTTTVYDQPIPFSTVVRLPANRSQRSMSVCTTAL